MSRPDEIWSKYLFINRGVAPLRRPGPRGSSKGWASLGCLVFRVSRDYREYKIQLFLTAPAENIVFKSNSRFNSQSTINNYSNEQ